MPREDITVLKIGDVIDIVLNDDTSRGIFINGEAVPNGTNVRLVFRSSPEIYITGLSTDDDGKIKIVPTATDGNGNPTDLGAENIMRAFSIVGSFDLLANKMVVDGKEPIWEFDEWIPVSGELKDVPLSGGYISSVEMGVYGPPRMIVYGKSSTDEFVVTGSAKVELKMERFIDPETRQAVWKNGSEGGTNG